MSAIDRFFARFSRPVDGSCAPMPTPEPPRKPQPTEKELATEAVSRVDDLAKQIAGINPNVAAMDLPCAPCVLAGLGL